MEIIEIKYITRDKASKIIETREPRGLFYEVDGDVYVGIDNSDDNAWVEEFKTKEECFDWLRGDREGTSEEKEEYLTELQRKQLKILKHYGSHKQLNQLVEECAELIVAIQKQQRYDFSSISDSVVEEMADVKNLIEQRVGFRGMAEHWVCPNCGRIYWFKEYIENYCGSCGQKLTVD